MKVKLLSNGGYKGMKNIDFNTIFPAVKGASCYGVTNPKGIDILIADLEEAGFETDGTEARDCLYFSNCCGNGTEYEVVEEDTV